MKNSPLFILLKSILLFSGILFSLSTSAQVSTYTFTQSNVAYATISAGTILGDTNTNNANFTALPIGFSYYFNGQVYTQFGVNANGYVALGNIGISSTAVISSGFSTNVISALNYDIQEQTGSSLQYQTTGSAPNRVLVVQWSNFRAAGVTTDTLNFQIRLNETTNTIVVRYGKCISAGVHNSETGLLGTVGTDYNNRYVSDTVNTWATSLAGTADTNICVINNVFRPAIGQTYTWTPPTPPAPPITMTFTAITITGMTVNWVDNSTTESSFLVYRSTDNITFTLINTTPSTSTGTTGTAYSLVQTGLTSATTYYYRIYSVGNTPSATYLSGNSLTLAGTICGTKKIGPTGDYTSITLAVAALQTNGLSCAVILELQAAYVSTVETFPIVVPFLGCTSVRTLTLRPETGATNRKVISDSLRAIDLNGTTWFTIDGRAGGTGTTVNLIIYDSLTTGNAIRFVNDAQNNTITYTGIQGATKGSTSNAVVQFSNALTAAGNSNNNINHCDITMSDSLPQILLYSNTTTGTNSSNVIANNNFHDWFFTGGANYGLSISTNNASWTISNNSFYQTTAQTFNTGNNTHAAINIAGTGGGPGGGASGNGFIVSGNFIGGSAPSCGGAAWTINGTSTPRFNGLNMNVGTTTASEVQGNTIRNISLTTAAAPGGGPGGGATIFNGINIAGGNVNIGTNTPNTIGSSTVNNSIQTIASASGVQTVGITTSSGGTVAITGNIIGGINANDSSSLTNTSAIGIIASSGIVTISNNTIGSNTLANSIVNAAGTGTAASTVTGISTSNTTTCTISGNLIKNLSNLYQGTTTASYVRGISTSGGVNTVNANTIEFLSNVSPQAGTNGSASVLGISQTSVSGGQSITNNVVRSLSNKCGTGNVVMTGIYYNGSINGTNVIEKNKIYRLSATLDTSVASIIGIQINGGHSTIDNNMISLGSDTTASAYTGANEYTGILKSTTSNNNFFFNSVNITGAGVANRIVDTYGFRRTVTGVDTLRNNIFVSTRSNTTPGGSHYAIALNNDTTVDSGKNDLYGTGTGYLTGISNGTTANSVGSWFTLTALDSNSVSLSPNFISSFNLHINNTNPSGLESRGYTIQGISIDIDNDIRPGPAGSTHGGATAPDIGADEFDGTLINLDMGAYALYRPANGCHGSSDSVSVSIKNFSTQTINFAVNGLALNVSVTGTNPVTFPVVNLNSGTLAAGATMNVVVSTTYNLSAVGSYVFHAYAVTTGDLFPNNDTLAPVTINISNGTTSPSLSSICSGLPVTLSVTGQTAGGTIQWQSSLNQTTWNNIAGGTTASVIVTPTVNTYYREVTCGTLNSNIDTINVTTVSVPTGVTGGTRCGPGSVTLHATAPNGVVWFDSATGGTIQDTGSVYNAIVSATRPFYATAIGNISAPKNLTTVISGPNNSGGVMFTVTALNNLNITGFDAQADSGVNTWRIYYRKDNMNAVPGSNTNSNGWIFVDSVPNVTSLGAGFLTPIPINMSVIVPAGRTYSFYVLVTSGPNEIYSPGTGLGNVNTSNLDLQVKDGYAGTLFNCTTSPRVFNGIVHYKTNCMSSRVLATATVTPPPAINATASASIICGGDSVSLHATSTNPNYQYSWSPTTGLSDSTGALVWAIINSPSTYYLQAFDSITGCSALDTVSVSAYPLPNINISANNDSICTGDSLYLNANLPLTYNIGTGNNSNLPNTYPAPYGNSSFGARHQMLIRASEMSNAGMVPGYINSLSFNVSNTNGSGALVNFTVRIGNTTATVLTDTFQVSAMTTVFTSTAYTPATGINTHAFTVPFHWNGTSNILIETCFNDTNSTVNASTRRSNTSFPSCTYYNADSANNCSKAVGTVITQRPNIRLGIRNQFSVRWITSQHLSDSLSATPNAVPTGTDVYHLTVTDTITGCINADSMTVTVDPPPVVNLGPDTNACESITLDAGNIGDDYFWNDSSTSQTKHVTVSGLYSVEVTHLGSCTATDSVNVVIVPLPVVTLTLPYDSLCTGDGTQVLSGGSPAGGTFSGTGVTGNNFDPVAAGAGKYAIDYLYTDGTTGCSNTATDSILVNVCIGIRTISNDGLINVFPNPVSKELTVDLVALKGNIDAEIMTPESKVISRRNFQGGASYPVNLENLSAGIYYLKINTSSSIYVIRFIKQ